MFVGRVVVAVSRGQVLLYRSRLCLQEQRIEESKSPRNVSSETERPSHQGGKARSTLAILLGLDRLRVGQIVDRRRLGLRWSAVELLGEEDERNRYFFKALAADQVQQSALDVGGQITGSDKQIYGRLVDAFKDEGPRLRNHPGRGLEQPF